MTLNRAIILGRVGGPPDIRTSASGDRIASFSLATSERWTDKTTGEKKESTEWHRIVIFNPQLAGVAEQWVKKGNLVMVEGQIRTRKYTDNAGAEKQITEIVLGRFDGKLVLAGEAGGARRSEADYGTASTRSPPAGPTTTHGLDDEVPF
jgi:single-strand DNA-binding protein